LKNSGVAITAAPHLKTFGKVRLDLELLLLRFVKMRLTFRRSYDMKEQIRRKVF
jgi:hypothetical protein